MMMGGRRLFFVGHLYVHSRTRKVRPVTPEEVWNQTLVRVSNRGEVEAAITALQEMVERGYTPSQRALGRLAHLCQSRGDREGFERVSTFIESAGVELEESLANTLVHGLVQGGQSQRACRIFREMQAQGIRVRQGVANSLLEARLEERDAGLSLELLGLLQSMNSPPQLHVSRRVLQVAGDLGVKGQSLAHMLMEVYRSTEHLVEYELAEDISSWLQQQPEHYTVSKATVDSKGVCSCCGALLEDSSLSSAQHEQLLQYADQQLSAEAQSFVNNKPELYEMELFKQSLQRSRGFSAVLDGLNVAHVYSARSNVRQMLRVASTVRDKLEGPVLIISRKHLAAKINPGKTTSLVEINQHFQRQGIYFFFTQNRVADDHYFLYGSLASGRRTYFVSNDMLGDHTAHSVSPDLVPVFRRWQRSRQVTMEAAPPSLRGRGRLQDTLKFPLAYRTVLQWSQDRTQCHIPIGKDSADSVQWLCVARV